jgi:hypothetical protein
MWLRPSHISYVHFAEKLRLKVLFADLLGKKILFFRRKITQANGPYVSSSRLYFAIKKKKEERGLVSFLLKPIPHICALPAGERLSTTVPAAGSTVRSIRAASDERGRTDAATG